MRSPPRNKVKVFLAGVILGLISSWAYILADGDYWLFIPLWAEIIFYPGLLVGNFCYDLFGNEPLVLLLGTLSVGLFYGIVLSIVHLMWILIIMKTNRKERTMKEVDVISKSKLMLSIFVIASVCLTGCSNQRKVLYRVVLDGNNSKDNPVRVKDVPTPAKVCVTYAYGCFTNAGPMPGWGAYGGDCIMIKGPAKDIGEPTESCVGPLGGYYKDLNALLACLSNTPSFEFELESGGWFEFYVWDDKGARANTATKRSGRMVFDVEVTPSK